MNNTKVLLDLSKMNYSDAAACENNNLIHQSKMAQIMSIWDGLYKKALGALDYSNEQNQEIHRHHNAISIFASRGAGKTTFLLSVLARIKNEYENVLCLKPLDPSLIEMKQHPFINIIAGIQELVEQKYDKEERYDTRREEFEYKKEFDNNYKKMLRALPFIDGVGKKGVYEEWDDEEFISILGMEKAEASNNLEKSFHDYVRMALKLLKKKCPVISFDDIDTEFKRGYEILEVIRKYLTSAQIVTIITGDLELYGKLVRKASWKCFDLAFLRKEVQYGKRKKEEFSLMVDQLENQYLVKILKPENRVLLKTIREYLEEENYSLEVLFSSQKEMEIDDCYSLIIELLGLEKNNLKVSEEIIRFLEGLSLRVQIRILTLLNNLLIAQGRYDKRKMLAKPELSTGLLDIFWNDINQKSHNAKALIKAGPIYTIDMLNFLVNTDALYIGANFLPETNDEILNKALFAIGARFNELVNRNHFLIFDYWMRISYVRVVSEKMGGKKDNEILNNFLGFTLLDADAGLNKSVGLAHAFCNSVLNDSFNDEIDVLPGTIFIGNKSPLQLLEYNYILSLLPMLGTMDAMKKESVFVSIYKLLSIIRDALFIFNKTDKNKTDENKVAKLVLFLNKLGQYRNYLEPNDGLHPQISSEKKEEEQWGVLQMKEQGDMESLKGLLMGFMRWSSMKVTVSCQLLDRVFTRFYFTLVHIDQNKEYYSNVGEKFNLYVIALLNAALVEDGADKGWEGLNFNNVGDIERIYIENVQIKNCIYRKKRQMTERICLYDWLAQCPLLTLFLNPFVVSLIERKTDAERVVLSELLKFNRNFISLDSLRTIRGKLEQGIEKCRNNIDWLDNFYKLEELEEEITFIQKYIDSGMDLWERREKLKRERDKIKKEIKRPLELENGKIITYRTNKSLVNDQYTDEQQNMRALVTKLENVNSEIINLGKRQEGIASWVKEEYNKGMEYKQNSGKSVYNILNSILVK